MRLVVPGYSMVAEGFFHGKLRAFRRPSMSGKVKEWYRADSPVADLIERLVAVSVASFRLVYVPPRPRPSHIERIARERRRNRRAA